MTDSTSESRDRTTIAPEVLITIARRGALEVEGVAGLARVSGGVNRLFRRAGTDGVRIEVKDDVVSAEIYLVVKAGLNLREVSREVQQAVTRSMEDIVGLEVGHININIEDVTFDQ